MTTTTTRKLTLEEAREYLRALTAEESARGYLAKEVLKHGSIKMSRPRGGWPMALLQDLGCVWGREYRERAIAARLMAKWPQEATRTFAIRLSRDVTLKDCIVPAEYREDPDREAVIPVEITLPYGYEVGESNVGDPGVYGPGDRRCELILYPVNRVIGNWFRLRGRQRYVIRLADQHEEAGRIGIPGLPVKVLD